MIILWYLLFVFIWIMALNNLKSQYKYFQSGTPATVLEISKYVGSFLLCREMGVSEYIMELVK